MFHTVIFDLDGTLLNTLDDLAAAGNHALSILAFPQHEPASYKQMIGNGVAKLVSRMLPEQARTPAIEALAYSLFNRYYQDHMLDNTVPYPGIMELLHSLKQNGISMAIASNKTHQFVGPIVERYFPGLFSFCMGTQEDTPPKPDPCSVLALLELLEADPATTLYCGDSAVDILTARNAGLPACGVLWGFRGEVEQAAAGADYLVESPSKLQHLIFSAPPKPF